MITYRRLPDFFAEQPGTEMLQGVPQFVEKVKRLFEVRRVSELLRVDEYRIRTGIERPVGRFVYRGHSERKTKVQSVFIEEPAELLFVIEHTLSLPGSGSAGPVIPPSF